MVKMFKLNKTGRVCYPFPWESTKMPQPWKSDYERVVIPLTEKEKMHAKPGTTCHIQVVKKSNMTLVKENRMALN